jgi:hypothetical protein
MPRLLILTAKEDRLRVVSLFASSTISAGIQLNERVSLRRHGKAIAWAASDICPGPSVAKPSGDHIPLGGFVFLKSSP